MARLTLARAQFGLINDSISVDIAYVFVMNLTERSPSFCSSTA